MNFSTNHNLRRFLSMALVLVMMTMLFAGCKKDAPVPETESSLNLNLPESTAPSTSEPAPTETTAPIVNENTGTVTGVLSIRSSPSTEATIVGTLYAGDKVEVSRREVVTGIDWAYILEPESGWVVMEFIEMDMPSQQPAPSDSGTPAGTDTPSESTTSSNTNTTNIKAVVNASGLYIRSEASKSGKIQGSYNKGDVVTILETKDGWGRTNKGWIKMEYVNTNSTSVSTNTNATTNNNNKNNNTTKTNITSNGSTTVIMKGIVKVTDLNIRSEGSINGDRLGNLTYGDRVEIMEKSSNWGRTKDGWVCLDYIYEDGTTGSKTASGTITATELFIRSGPGKGYNTVGSYKSGDSVSILEQFTYNGTTWGCTNQGWISMDYVDVGNSGNTSTNSQMGTVIGNGLYIRNGAGTDYPTIGSLNYGDRVTILEQTKVGDTTWGKISQGWISLDFVSLD